MNVVHLIPGPDQHGVVLHAGQIARACRHDVVRVRGGEQWPELGELDVVHVPFTDRLFGADLDAAGERFRSLTSNIGSAELSVTLHDVPHDDSPLQRRRLELYREVVGAARGVMVNSRVELGLVEGFADHVHSLRVLPLPVLDAPPVPDVPLDPGSVAVLGFVYPDRGYEDVLAALPPAARLVALGRASDGHEDLPDRYARLAAGRWTMTGYLSDDELARRLVTAAVPVAPNRRVTASASINSWIAHGRRPLVPDSAYARELALDRPGTITIYEVDGLRAAIERALADPVSTRLADGVARGATLDEVAAGYREHLIACRPPRPVPVDGGYAVPGNSWDLLAGLPTASPTVGVVVPYFDAQAQLDRTLAALTKQTAARLEVIVADDGSAVPPDVSAAGDLPVRVVRQDDRGFRAAAARNLGAAATDAEVLVFLDADTAPEPEFVERLTRLPALCPDVVAVGRRRHADLATDPPTVLPEPRWLRDAYAASADLRHADARSYRFVISAVLAVPHRLFAELGGFDERFVGYGGEDWELAHRAWCAGAVFAHVPDAVAWHDGPDWAARPGADAPGAKNGEALALATLLPDPVERGGGQWTPYPAVVVRVCWPGAAALLATARSAFGAGVDAGFWIDATDDPQTGLVLTDPRLHVGAPPAEVLARARCVVDVTSDEWVDLSGLDALCAAAGRHGTVVTPAVRVRASRAVNRPARWSPDDPDAWSAWCFGRHDRSTPGPGGPLDLAAVLRRC